MPLTGAFIVPHPPILLPEVGRGEERKIQKTADAYCRIAEKVAELKPDTLIVISPHATLYSDYFHLSPGKKARGDLRRFGENRVCVEADYDTELVRLISHESEKAEIPAGTLGEADKNLDHGTLIPLYFINKKYTRYKLIRMGLSGLTPLTHYRFGECIARAATQCGRNIVLIASGDLSHKLKEDGPYGYTAEGPVFDRQVTEAMAEGDFMHFLTFNPDLCEAAAECGLRSFIIMAGALDGKSVNAEFMSYEGTFGVGYAVCAYEITGEDESRHFGRIFEQKECDRLMGIQKNEDGYVRLARLSLEEYVKRGKKANVPEELPAELTERQAGVFVSLKKHGYLRGCIGTISPTKRSVAEEIMRNAISAGTEDPRFSPVTEEELPELVYSVDVLADPETISSVDQLDVKRYGVIVTSGHRRGLLLPNLDGVDTPEQQVLIALQKAGIPRDQSYTMERFEVVRHK